MLNVTENGRRFNVTSEKPDALKQLVRYFEDAGHNDVRTFRGSLSVPLSKGVELLAFAGDAQWSDNALLLASNMSDANAQQARARLEVEEALRAPDEYLAGLDIIESLDACQREAVAAMAVPSLAGLAIFDEQGVGKTAMSIAAFHRLRSTDVVRKLIVVTPKSTIGSWLNEFERLLPGKYVVRSCAGSKQSRRKALMSPHDVLIMTYEAVTSDAGLVQMVAGVNPNSYMLVVDESYMVKNDAALRTQAVKRVRERCARAVILCGTPAPNRPGDIVSQINVADGGVAFRGIEIPDDRDEATAVVRGALSNAIYLRRLKSEVLAFVPEKSFEIQYLELQPAQQLLYNELRDGLASDLRSVSDEGFEEARMSFLARRSALLQVCSHPGAVTDSYTETPTKLVFLDDLIDRLTASGEKVVLWSFYRYSLSVLEARYRQKGVVRVDGSVSSAEERANRIRRFQTDPETRIFIGNAAAAGAGITLTAARHAIYESLSNQGAHYMQSLDRIHRRGQDRDVTFHVLVCNQTVEEKHLETLIEKERMSRELLPSSREVTLSRLSMLAELDALDPDQRPSLT